MNTKRNDGGPAFPNITPDMPVMGGPGMTLRDWFAGQALNVAPRIDDDAIDACGTELCVKATAQWAYRIADAMLEEREK